MDSDDSYGTYGSEPMSEDEEDYEFERVESAAARVRGESARTRGAGTVLVRHLAARSAQRAAPRSRARSTPCGVQ